MSGRARVQKELVDGNIIQTSPEHWAWPVPPNAIQVYDKYSDTYCTLRVMDAQWEIRQKGNTSIVRFADSEVGTLQRKLVLLTQGKSAPGTIRRFAAVLISDWEDLRHILMTSPQMLRDAWGRHATTSSKTGAFKAVLKLACQAAVGHWSSQHLALVNSLDTLANNFMRQRVRAIETRGKLAPAAMQAEIVQVLDTASHTDDLSEIEVEGAVTLALIFQHGVRSVQVLCLETTHVQFFRDATDDLACIASFHAAKQREGKTWEIARQIKPEWVPLIARLHAMAVASGRQRLMTTEDPSALWYRAKAICGRFGVKLSCTAMSLRHSAAQALADAGHSRGSIRGFLGHTMDQTARSYIKASLQQAALINTALGASKLYGSILSVANKTFVSLEEMLAADQDRQVGAVIGERLIAGVGLCSSGQDSCAYNPVTSCYGCRKFLPSRDRDAHMDAIEGMREQVTAFIRMGLIEGNPAYRQLITALSGAQQALLAIERMEDGR